MRRLTSDLKTFISEHLFERMSPKVVENLEARVAFLEYEIREKNKIIHKLLENCNIFGEFKNISQKLITNPLQENHDNYLTNVEITEKNAKLPKRTYKNVNTAMLEKKTLKTIIDFLFYKMKIIQMTMIFHQ